jgi:spermidine synthase
MSKPHPDLSTALGPSRWSVPVLLLVFVASGCSALIYEVVWFQLLQLVIGSSAVSLGVLLGTFMGGMCLGSVTLPRLVPARWHPLRVFALLEVGIAVIGLAVLVGMFPLEQWYTAYTGHGPRGILLRGLMSAVCLLPPAWLMGGTLPIAARWLAPLPEGASWVGFCYSANIVGAVFGSLLAGFYLLRLYDLATATYVAAIINGIGGWAAFTLAAVTPQCVAPDAPAEAPGAVRVTGSASVYVAIALSGLCALSAEVIWTRLLSLMLGGTVYTFAIILAVFLTGLAIGSGVGSMLARGTRRPRTLLASCQLFLAAAIAWTAYMLTNSLPYWPITPGISTSPWFTFQLDLLRCFWAVLPAAILWGTSFPLALAAVVSPGSNLGRFTGGIYAANTLGAIAGALGTSLVLIPWLGTQQSHRLLIGLSTAAALLLLAPCGWPFRSRALSGELRGRTRRLGNAVALTGVIGLAVLLGWSVAPVPGEVIAWGRYLPVFIGQTDILYAGEGMNTSVAVSQVKQRPVRLFHVGGKVEASGGPEDKRLQRLLGHIPALLHPKPRSVLVVGCGTGMTAGSFVLHPGVERIVICEIEPLVPQVVAEYFSQENYNVLRDPRVTVVYDDARHYLLTTHERFDIITSDPMHPWIKGAATLYTEEYFELCKRHLHTGGLLTQWLPLSESDPDTVKSALATFFEAFPGGTLWSSHLHGTGYDLVLLGQVEPTRIHVDDLQQRLASAEYRDVRNALYEVGFSVSLGILSSYAGQDADLQPWLGSAAINRDRNLRLQYLAGMGSNQYRREAILKELLAYRTYPETLFVASEWDKQELRKSLQQSALAP